MKLKNYQVAFPATLVVVMVAVLSTIFFANANLSFADSATKKKSVSSAVEYTDLQIKQLQDALNLTEAQQGLWNNLTKVMRENAKDMDAFSKTRGENFKTMNSVEHLKYHRQVTEAHLNQLNKLIPPFDALYASMSDEQKKTTDTLFRTGKHGKHKMK